jgi:hypothetical protein
MGMVMSMATHTRDEQERTEDLAAGTMTVPTKKYTQNRGANKQAHRKEANKHCNL